MSEEQIIDIFSRVGQVNNFRLVHDKETGKPKGFGFLEFADPDNAAAAVRNLNDHDVMGRKLRVDWSNDSGSGDTAPSQAQQPHTNGNTVPAPAPAPVGGLLPPLPPGTDPAGLTAPDAISKTLATMPAPQLLDIISQMKGMVADNPAQVTQLFTVAPQLAYAIFQALLLLGLTDTSVLTQIIQAVPGPQAQAAPPVAQPPPPQYAAPPQAAYVPYPQHVPTPPVQAPYQPPQPQQPAAAPDQQALIQQVLAMTREQIYALPPETRDQVLALRAQFNAPV